MNGIVDRTVAATRREHASHKPNTPMGNRALAMRAAHDICSVTDNITAGAASIARVQINNMTDKTCGEKQICVRVFRRCGVSECFIDIKRKR